MHSNDIKDHEVGCWMDQKLWLGRFCQPHSDTSTENQEVCWWCSLWPRSAMSGFFLGCVFDWHSFPTMVWNPVCFSYQRGHSHIDLHWAASKTVERYGWKMLDLHSSIFLQSSWRVIRNGNCHPRYPLLQIFRALISPPSPFPAPLHLDRLITKNPSNRKRFNSSERLWLSTTKPWVPMQVDRS